MAMVLDALVSAVTSKLVDEGIKKIASQFGVNSDLEDLRRNVKKISLVLVDAESKKIEDKSIAFWLAELREVLYDAEDLLDDFAAAPADSTSESFMNNLLSIFRPSKIEKAPKRIKTSTRIENINSTLSRLTSDKLILQLLANLPNADKKVSRYNSSRITDTCSFQLDSEIVGIDYDATDLVDRIARDSDRKHSVFAITGMGGIGKTTLARKVFNHHLIQNRFDNTVWVCVTSNCTGEYLLKDIVRSIDKNYSESGVSLSQLSPKLIEVVKEKKVFIVLDDIWDSHVWEKFLRVPLHTGAKHSQILITTRNQQVAMKMNVAHMHPMKSMLQSDGWSMLCKIVFQEEDKGDANELEKVGKEIVDRCKCLPLAIKVVGGVLKMTDRTVAAWTRVLSSKTWSMLDLPENVLPSLLLSYEDLPLHLKQCFTFCSLFPEGHVFYRFNLEHLWIAERFIKKEEEKDVEYSARDYYNELVMRNILQVTPWDISKCIMHDLLRSLAIFVSQNQYIYLQPEDFRKSGLTRRHHLSFIGKQMKDEELSQEIKEEYCVRTLLLSDNPRIKIVSPELLSSLRQLRVLDVQGTGIEKLPDSLGDLIHLKFLRISSYLATKKTPLKKPKLPDSIIKLKNLQCLQVYGLDNMPIGLDNLKNLRVLDEFVVNDRTSSIGRRYTPNLKELKDLSQLTHLSISNLERVASKEEAQEAAIEKKTSLESLTLGCDLDERGSTSDEDIKKIEEVFAGIRIPENLTNLRISGFFGKQLPDHITSDRLRQLTSLVLMDCMSLERLPSLGDMPNLQRLEIESESVVELGSEFLGSLKFPKLQELKLVCMLNLERMFDVEEGAFPCLVKLSISDCLKLNSLGEGWNHATCLKTLNVSGVENLKSIENLTSISRLEISLSRLKYVKNLPSLKRMTIFMCPALEDVNEVGELDFLEILDYEIKTLPRWLENITPPKELLVDGSKELVLGIQESVEAQNIIKKCLHAEVRSFGGSYSYNSNSTAIPENLTNLRISGFFGKQLPDHITSDRLRQLTSLVLMECCSLERLPSLGDMPNLQRLEIDELPSVVEIGSEFLGSLKFPKLQKLELAFMRNLERMFDVEEGAFPCLVELSIFFCPKLNSLEEGWNHATCLKTLNVSGEGNLKSIENLTSISTLSISCSRLKYVKNLPTLKHMTIWESFDLEDVNEVGELDFLEIVDSKIKTLPRWLENITPPKKLFVKGSEELVLGIQGSVEAQNIIKKCLHAEVRSFDGSYSYNSNSTGSSGASSSSVTIT